MSTSPSIIGRYLIVERIGQGGMGALFLSWDPMLERQVAIKLLREADNDDLRVRFTREARSVAKLRHPNIVTIFDVGEHEGQPFIAMEYIHGQTLGQIIQSGAPISLLRKLEIIAELCAGLGYAHKAGIVHRDIKPANLMVDSDNVLKVLDFGIARLAESGMTQAGMLIGTLNYMSPEQVTGQQVDARSDIFAVGAVCYELLTRRQAFVGGLHDGILNRILHEQPTALEQLEPGLDPDIIQIVMRAMAKRAEDRYQDLASMRKEILRVHQRVETTLGASLESDETTILPERSVITPRPQRRTDPEDLKRRRLQQIEDHIAAAERAYAGGDFEAAIASCEQAMMLDPEDPRGFELSERCRQALDQRQAHRWLDEAQEQLRRGALSTAMHLVEQALSLAPDSTPALDLRQAIEQRRIEREQERQRAAALQVALDRAAGALASRDLDSAIRAADQALAIDPTAEVARDIKMQATLRIEERARERAAEEERAREQALAAARAVIADAQHAFQAGDRADAFALLDQAAPHELIARAREQFTRQAREIAAREKAEAERKAREKAEAERIAREKAEAERKAREKAEAERIAREKAEAERIAREKAEAERIAREKAEAERIAREKAEAERRAREKAEAERIAREKAEAERKAREKADAERKAREKAEAERQTRQQAEADRLQREEVARVAAAEQQAREKAAAERKAREQADAERIAREQAEAERKAREKAAAEQKAREEAEAKRLAAEQAERARTAAKKAEAERKAAEQAERAEKERRAAEKAEAERLALQKAQAEQQARDKAEVDRRRREEAARVAAAEQVAREKAEAARAAEKADAERKAAEQAERAEKAEQERRAGEKAEKERKARQAREEADAERRRADAARIAMAAAEKKVREQADAERAEHERAAILGREQAAPATGEDTVFIADPTQRLPQATPFPISPVESSGLKPVHYLAAAAVLVALVIGGYYATSQSGDPDPDGVTAVVGAPAPAGPAPSPPVTAPPAPTAEPPSSVAAPSTSAAPSTASPAIEPTPTPPASSTENVDREVAALRARAQTQLSRGGTLEALATINAALKIQPDDPESRRLKTDVLRDAKTRVTGIRNRATAAGATESSANFKVARQRESEAQRQEKAGQIDNAVRSLLAASGLYTKAADEAAARSAAVPATPAAPSSTPAPIELKPSPPQVSPPPAPPAPAPVVPEPRTVPDPPRATPETRAPVDTRAADESAIRGVLRAYEQAFRTLNLAAVQRLHPTVDARILKTSFDAARAQDIQIGNERIVIDGTTATVTAQVEQSYSPKVGRARSTKLPATFQLQKSGGTWVIISRK